MVSIAREEITVAKAIEMKNFIACYESVSEHLKCIRKIKETISKNFARLKTPSFNLVVSLFFSATMEKVLY